MQKCALGRDSGRLTRQTHLGKRNQLPITFWGKEMPATKPWRDDLIAALASLGGAGHLNDIYQAVERIRTPLTKQWKGTVRCKLQQYSSDSRWWRHASTRNRADLFTN